MQVALVHKAEAKQPLPPAPIPWARFTALGSAVLGLFAKGYPGCSAVLAFAVTFLH